MDAGERTRRRREWFDDDAFWRDLYSFMFTNQRFAAAPRQVDQILRLAKGEPGLSHSITRSIPDGS